MNKVLLVLLMGFAIFGAKFAFADARLDSLQGDARLIDDVDIIFLGYANKVADYQNTVDFRLTDNDFYNYGGSTAPAYGQGTREWGGVIDGEHTGLGVIGTYVNRPFSETNANVNNTPLFGGSTSAWMPTGGSGNWSGTVNNVFLNLLGGPEPFEPYFYGQHAQIVDYIVTPANKLDLFWARASDNSSLGLSLNYADNQPPIGFVGIANGDQLTNPVQANSIGEVKSNDYSRVLGANVGLGLKNAGFDELNIHAGYSYGTFNNSGIESGTGTAVLTNGSLKDNGIYTITLGAQAKSNLDQDTNFHYFVDGSLNQLDSKDSLMKYQADLGPHQTGADEDFELVTDHNSLNLEGGLGCNHKVNNGGALFSLGLVANFISSTDQLSETSQAGTATTAVNGNGGKQDLNNLNVVWNGSADVKVTNWLNLRAGLSEHLFDRDQTKNTVYTYNAGGTLTNTAITNINGDSFAGATSFSLGFGIHWQNWTLDGDITASSFENTINNIQPGNGLFYSNGNLLTTSEADLRYNF